ncbi:AraC family transcriptional regulator [Paenibacillus eucommiae]|uniref:AraC-like DNA-binding protein n=1 Tax=Paenibacillus eucommiae TaxID=1355755 RepID=A0ABS4ISW9_9BACL|nr:AraC family transcriptional regulator [Paenibacillus eucommiae]MBP1990672.1 AraC-like DNA-binding protein [Paenibacillus eucommiae]
MWRISLSHLKPYLQNHSLLSRLIMSFLLVIMMITAFHFFSFSFLKNRIQQEIIKYNSLNLKYTAESYEKHLQLIENTMVNLFFDEKMNVIKSNPTVDNFKLLNLFSSQLQRLASNEQLYLADIIIYFGDSGLTIGKEGVRSANDLFQTDLINETYSYFFWQDQISKPYHYKVFPTAEFKRVVSAKQISSRGMLVPVVFKNRLNPNMYFITLIEANEAYKAFFRGIDDNFYISDDSGQVLFSSNPANQPLQSELQTFASSGEGSASQGNNFYFYKKERSSGLTYVHVVPNNTISSQIQRLNMILLIILSLVIVISILISIYLSSRFSSPVRQIIEAIQKPNQALAMGTSIHEFNLISEKIGTMMVRNEEISSDLHHKNSIIKKYGYINKLKSIYSSYNKVEEDLLESGSPFYLVIFSVAFTREFHKLFAAEPTRASYYINELIQLNLSEAFPKSVTIQVEKDQIFSLIFVNEQDPQDQSGKLLEKLRWLGQIFDRDQDYYLLTMAVNPVLRSSTEFTEAYEETLEMLQLRKMMPGTQMIIEPIPESFHLLLAPSLDQEFFNHLQAGNDAVVQIVQRMLQQLHKKDANLYQYTHLSREIVGRVIKTLTAANIDTNATLGTESPYKKLQTCMTVDDYSLFFEDFLYQSLSMIREKKMGQEPLKDAILSYMHRHYQEDISLESVAEKFNLSSGYLSIFFKEKTQTNFLYYLNELRINKAKELLLGTNMKIHDVGEQVGFQNANSFIRLFKKFTGIPPGEYRRMNHIS